MQLSTAQRVLLFVPNLIGYARFALLFWGFFLAARGEAFSFLCAYAASYLLDAFDGLAARQLDQTSRYGAMLDMLCDRAATTALCVAIAQQSPEFTCVS